MANPEPVFLIRDAEVETAANCGKDGAHLRGSFRQDRVSRNGVGFNMGDLADDLVGRTVDLLISPSINEFRNERKPELRLNAVSTGSGTMPEKRGREDAALLSDLYLLCDTSAPAANPCGEDELKRFAALPQGVCVLCRTKSGMDEAVRAFPGFEARAFSNDDRHAYNCILYAGSVETVTAPFDRLLLWEGEAVPGEAALWQSRTGAEVKAAGQSNALRARMTALRYQPAPGEENAPGIAAMRDVYLALRRGDEHPHVIARTLNQTESHVLTALFIMKHMKLIDLSLTPYRAERLPRDRSVKMDMSADPLYRLIHLT